MIQSINRLIPRLPCETLLQKFTLPLRRFSFMVRSESQPQHKTRTRNRDWSRSQSGSLYEGKASPSASASKSIEKQLSSTTNKVAETIKMKVYPIRALQDNYMYLLVDEQTKNAAAVDPVNASAMASAIADHDVDLKCILTTHHHYDHAHGNSDMLSMFPDITVYGGDQRIQALTKSVAHGDLINLGTLTVECLSTPCHTRGHICYYVHNEERKGSGSQPLRTMISEVEQLIENNHQDEFPASSASCQRSPASVERVVFTGDTLFIAGCGRFFEGSSEQMDRNLNSILGKLPSDTRVYCGHEYTVANLKFALTVEPQNSDIKSKLDWAQNKVAKREPTVPSTIGEEKRINPFMRLSKESVKNYTNERSELEVMSVLRQRKNDFVP